MSVANHIRPFDRKTPRPTFAFDCFRKSLRRPTKRCGWKGLRDLYTKLRTCAAPWSSWSWWSWFSSWSKWAWLSFGVPFLLFWGRKPCFLFVPRIIDGETAPNDAYCTTYNFLKSLCMSYHKFMYLIITLIKIIFFYSKQLFICIHLLYSKAVEPKNNNL